MRNPALPEVPTFVEQSYPMLEDVAWMGLWIKPGVPDEVQNKTRQGALKLMSQPAVEARLAVMGSDAGSGASPEEPARSLREASDK